MRFRVPSSGFRVPGSEIDLLVFTSATIGPCENRETQASQEAHREPPIFSDHRRRDGNHSEPGPIRTWTSRRIHPGAGQPDHPKGGKLIRSRQLSPTDLTRACLERIERYNPKLNAFITVTPDLALEQATAMEAELAAGTHRGPLHGIPIALKDNIDTAGVRTTAGSAVFADRTPTEDAEVTRRLKEAGAVLLGKLNMHEWAAGGSSVISFWGPVHNPWNLDHETGGSSGGSRGGGWPPICAWEHWVPTQAVLSGFPQLTAASWASNPIMEESVTAE